MIIKSVFDSQQPIPVRYTFDGKNVSPPLRFLQVPQEAKSLVLIVDDPDAPRGTFDHWIVWNIPPTLIEISEGAPEFNQPLSQIKFGINGFGNTLYQGPSPPQGPLHHYHFKLFALNEQLAIPAEASKQVLEKTLQKFLIDQAELVGTYQRP